MLTKTSLLIFNKRLALLQIPYNCNEEKMFFQIINQPKWSEPYIKMELFNIAHFIAKPEQSGLHLCWISV